MPASINAAVASRKPCRTLLWGNEKIYLFRLRLHQAMASCITPKGQMTEQ